MRVLAIGFVGDHGGAAPSQQPPAQIVGVVSFVAQHLLGRRQRPEKRSHRRDIGNVSTGQQQGVRAASVIDYGVDFCRSPAARAADGLGLLPPFPPLAERWALTAVLSTMMSFGARPEPTTAAKMRCQ